MIDALFNSPNYVTAKKALDAVVLRQEAIATNIANLETPAYRRVDIAPSFKSELARACSGGDAQQIAALNPSITTDANAVPNSRDGNSVNFEHEMMQLNQNMLAHALETQLVSNAILKLKMAISGKI
jgi:flagellar basal-body rod protein FlgB